MSLKKLSVIAGLALAWMSGTASMAGADTDLRAEVEALKAQVAQMRAESQESWLSEAQATQVRELVQEVLADADTRSALGEDGFYAGHDGKFFLASKDGQFRMDVGGQIQFRYVYNSRDDGSDDLEGFQARRSKVFFSGTLYEEFDFQFQVQASRSSGTVSTDSIWVRWRFAEGFGLTFATVTKAPFGREELTSSKRQLAVERSHINTIFSPAKVEGVMLEYATGDLKLKVMVNDGFGSQQEDFTADDTDFGLTGRAEYFIALQEGAKSRAFRDFSGKAGDAWGMLLAAAFHYEDKDSATGSGSYMIWTVEAGIEGDGFNAFVAFFGIHEDDDLGQDGDGYALLIQGGYMIVPEVFEIFARYEHIWTDSTGFAGPSVFDNAGALALADDIDIITLGGNYFIKSHNVKVTGDVMFVLDPIAGTSSGTGLRNSGVDDQLVFRFQVQVNF